MTCENALFFTVYDLFYTIFGRFIYPTIDSIGMSTENRYENLRSVKIAELLADGVRLVHAFTLPDRMASVNGVLCAVSESGQILGEINIRGSPIGSCGLCGYMPLYNHFTLKNKKTGEELNVGCECLAEIMGAEKGARIQKAVESIRRKVSSDFRRPIKQADINAWLQALSNPTESRNKRIDEEIAKFPHYYYQIPVDMPEAYKGTKKSWVDIEKETGLSYNQAKEDQFVEAWAKVPHEKFNDQQAIMIQNAKAMEEKSRNYWNYHVATFGRKDWNPQNMKTEYEMQASIDGIQTEKIKWRPLTEQERTTESKLIDAAINEWIAKVSGGKKQ